MVRFSTKPLTSSRLHKLLVDGGLGYKGHSITDKLINNAHIIIAEDDEKIIGCVTISFDGVCNYIVDNVAVIPTYRRRGIGTSLVQEANKYLDTVMVQGDTVFLWTDAHLKTFYEKVGFKPIQGMIKVK